MAGEGKGMTGMALSRAYWEQVGAPSLRERFPALWERCAAGLIGEGSECFGYDDAVSRDHDWGPGFCLWLSPEEERLHGDALRRWYAALPGSFGGFPRKERPERVGVFSREAFFARFLGRLPRTGIEWLVPPEHAFAVCTNGQLFHDPSGEMTAMVESLRQIPEPVRQKKLAARCVTMLQSGQYDLPRCFARGETAAARLAADEFVRAAASALCLLQGRWAPFYKWLPRALRDLPEPVPAIAERLFLLLGAPGEPLLSASEQRELVEELCLSVADLLRAQGLTALPGCDMEAIGLDIQKHIEDEQLRRLPVLAG